MMVWTVCKLALLMFVLSGTKTTDGKETFTAKVVEDIVQNEIAKKMPAAAAHSNKKKKALTGVHLKAATDAINKLVDESIVDRVQEAEKEVSQMLLKSIEHHIQDAGKVLLKQDENPCRDKIAGCGELDSAGVCETSKDAMVINCPYTCNFCSMLEDLRQQSERENAKKERQTKLKEKKLREKHKNKKLENNKKHKKVKHQKASNLAPEEVQLIHQNMLDQAIDHANLPMAVSRESNGIADVSDTEETVKSKAMADYEKQQKEQEEEKAEQEAQEAEVEKLAAAEREKESEEVEAKKEEEAKKQREAKKAAEREMKKKKKAALRKAKEAKQAKEAAREAAREAKEAAQLAAKKPTSISLPAPPVSSNQGIGNQYDMNPAEKMANYDAMPIVYPQVLPTDGFSHPISQFIQPEGSTLQNDLTETDIVNRDKQEDTNDKTHKQDDTKISTKSVKKKTDTKLKHEIESMVDKAFGELLL